MVKALVFPLVAFCALFLAGCGSSEQTSTLTADERFAKAMDLFNKEDYLEAINDFTVITLQFQGSQHAADAQFYLGECRYRRAEYLLAAFEYGVLKKSYPASPRVPEAQYKLALSYYELSPRASLDQQYTRKAIDEFQSFVEYYPSNPLAADATAKIKELDAKLAKKLYDAARQYVVLERYVAALRYFDDVIDQYHDTDWAPLAFLDKVELLINRKKYADAQTNLTRFLSRYPNSVLKARADELQDRLAKEFPPAGRGSATGTATSRTGSASPGAE
ncbi:MAG TPA: outer membrane protein assembly factor BamD [Bacteroidota bacterium]|nr:outer membrane protein assembly factor BamD [Bacteroidota bacterium]